jgi:acyl-CoA synthetase (NDP forming)
LLGDVAVRISPLSDLDAAEMVRSLRTFPLLTGYRGSPTCDVASVEQVLLRLSALVEEHPEVAELDLNPVIAGPGGALIADGKIRVRPPAPARPYASLRG